MRRGEKERGVQPFNPGSTGPRDVTRNSNGGVSLEPTLVSMSLCFPGRKSFFFAERCTTFFARFWKQRWYVRFCVRCCLYLYMVVEWKRVLWSNVVRMKLLRFWIGFSRYQTPSTKLNIRWIPSTDMVLHFWKLRFVVCHSFGDKTNVTVRSHDCRHREV